MAEGAPFLPALLFALLAPPGVPAQWAKGRGAESMFASSLRVTAAL